MATGPNPSLLFSAFLLLQSVFIREDGALLLQPCAPGLGPTLWIVGRNPQHPTASGEPVTSVAILPPHSNLLRKQVGKCSCSSVVG